MSPTHISSTIPNARIAVIGFGCMGLSSVVGLNSIGVLFDAEACLSRDFGGREIIK
ncbi:hypothetical protein [Parapedobacter soli]|uniref:hypothetical protein n=1 Tax=Parapedobacter soli TaxID=416955 RepID=UPI0021C7D627|nr:hypothetical protein [Parapedobacter soli]